MSACQLPIVFQVGSKLRSLGTAAGVDNDVRQRCLERMRAWVRLAESALDAEFPAFEIAQAFSVFVEERTEIQANVWKGLPSLAT